MPVKSSATLIQLRRAQDGIRNGNLPKNPVVIVRLAACSNEGESKWPWIPQCWADLRISAGAAVVPDEGRGLIAPTLQRQPAALPAAAVPIGMAH